MPSFDYRSGPFLLNSSDDGDTDGEKIPSMSIGSGSLLVSCFLQAKALFSMRLCKYGFVYAKFCIFFTVQDDMSMPRLQFRDWMGKPDANDNEVPEVMYSFTLYFLPKTPNLNVKATSLFFPLCCYYSGLQ